MKLWQKWAIGVPVGAFVVLVIAMLVSEDVLAAVGWITPIAIVLLAVVVLVGAAAVKFLMQQKRD